MALRRDVGVALLDDERLAPVGAAGGVVAKHESSMVNAADVRPSLGGTLAMVAKYLFANSHVFARARAFFFAAKIWRREKSEGFGYVPLANTLTQIWLNVSLTL